MDAISHKIDLNTEQRNNFQPIFIADGSVNTNIIVATLNEGNKALLLPSKGDAYLQEVLDDGTSICLSKGTILNYSNVCFVLPSMTKGVHTVNVDFTSDNEIMHQGLSPFTNARLSYYRHNAMLISAVNATTFSFQIKVVS